MLFLFSSVIPSLFCSTWLFLFYGSCFTAQCFRASTKKVQSCSRATETRFVPFFAVVSFNDFSFWMWNTRRKLFFLVSNVLPCPVKNLYVFKNSIQQSDINFRFCRNDFTLLVQIWDKVKYTRSSCQTLSLAGNSLSEANFCHSFFSTYVHVH